MNLLLYELFGYQFSVTNKITLLIKKIDVGSNFTFAYALAYFTPRRFIGYATNFRLWSS